MSWGIMSPFYREFDPWSDVFGGFEDFLVPSSAMSAYNRPSWYSPPSLDWYGGGQQMAPRSRERQQRQIAPAMANVINDRNQFAVNLDVHQFKPEEITVKTTGDYVTVEGRHEEREDPHGYIKRHFVRKYMLPEDVKPEAVSSTLSADGVLTIKAPKAPKAIEASNEREIPIERSSLPASATAALGYGRQQQQPQHEQQMETTEQPQQQEKAQKK